MASPPPPPLTLSTPLADLSGVGAKRAQAFAKLKLHRAGDLLFHFPLRQNDFGPVRPISEIVPDSLTHLRGEITDIKVSYWQGRHQIQMGFADDTGSILVRFFNCPWLAGRLQPDLRLEMYGKVRLGRRGPELANPRFKILPDSLRSAGAAQPTSPIQETIYPATAELASGTIAGIIHRVLDPLLQQVYDPLPEPIRQTHRLPDLAWAIRALHREKDEKQIQAARHRLAFEELLAFQTAMQQLRAGRVKTERALPLGVSPEVDRRIRARFPFPLMPAQDQVIAEIVRDVGRSVPMHRLLQGDVGSGKTVVAVYACLSAIANQSQAAILAPTELLAEQHYANVCRYLAGSKVNLALLTGSTPGRERAGILRQLENGALHLVIGTHALLEEKVRFHKLALAVIDEQHKFGVEQRAALRKRMKDEGGRMKTDEIATVSASSFPLHPSSFIPHPSSSHPPSPIPHPLTPHTLVMTATPIPRTLAMTVYGEMEVSVMPGRPPGRQPIVTRLLIPAQRNDAYRVIRQHVERGEQAYIVCPAVGETESELRAAIHEHRRLQQDIFPDLRIGLVHGPMPGDEREQAMSAFRRGQTHVLVGTTVIEVGVDVPNATVMLIEHAERFGLCQLHQLRGRIGRGTKPGVCLLLPAGGGEVARERLNVLVKSDDGFVIAEEDLRLRGPGEFLGKAQSGLPPFRVADMVEDLDLLLKTRQIASDWLRQVEADARLGGMHQRWMERVRKQFPVEAETLDVG